MNRRRFFGFLAAAPVAVAAMPVAPAKGGPLFPFAKGIGTIGEGAGETIMPLKRLPSGRLGMDAIRNITITPWQSPPEVREPWERDGFTVHEGVSVNVDGEPRLGGTGTVVEVVSTTRKPA